MSFGLTQKILNEYNIFNEEYLIKILFEYYFDYDNFIQTTQYTKMIESYFDYRNHIFSDISIISDKIIINNLQYLERPSVLITDINFSINVFKNDKLMFYCKI